MAKKTKWCSRTPIFWKDGKPSVNIRHDKLTTHQEAKIKRTIKDANIGTPTEVEVHKNKKTGLVEKLVIFIRQ